MSSNITRAEVVYFDPKKLPDNVKNNNVYRYFSKFSKLFDDETTDGIMTISKIGAELRQHLSKEGIKEAMGMDKEIVLFSSLKDQYCFVFSKS